MFPRNYPMRSRAEQRTRFLAFDELMDTSRETCDVSFSYYGMINREILAVAQEDDPRAGEVYLSMENIILDRFYGI
jgi:hypothetical protein